MSGPDEIPPSYSDQVPDRRVQMKHVPTGEMITCTTPQQAADLRRFLENPMWVPKPMPDAKK